jgi:hypothetical protein
MASDVSVLELAPPGTNAAIGFSVRGLLNSPMAKDFATSGQGLPMGLTAAPKVDGFDPAKDLDQLLVFIKPDGDKSTTLLVLTGRFDVEKMGADAKRYHDFPMLESSKGEVLAILDGETAIYGDQAVVEAAIDRRGSTTALTPDLAARIDAARKKYDLWGEGESPDGLMISGEAAGMFRSLDRFSFGATMRPGLEMTAEVHTKSAADASKMSAAIGIIEAALKPAENDGTKFEVHSDGGTFQISVSIPEDALKAKRSVLSGLFAPEGKEGAPAATMPSEASAPTAATTTTASEAATTSAAPQVETVVSTATVTSAAATPAEAGAATPAVAPPAEVAMTAGSATQVPPDPPAPPVLEAAAPALPAAVAPEQEAPPAPPAPPKPVAPVKLPNRAEIVKAPNGDTMLLKLPGAK